MKDKQNLKEREKLFCLNYCKSRDPRLAAAQSGYGVFGERTAIKLLSRSDIRKEIGKIDKTKIVTTDEVVAGYRQLAFGSIADALKLVYSEKEPDKYDIEKLDLFNISEIKRPKEGSIEIKFFDRLKALEHLENLCCCDSEENSALPFYAAIEKSAAALKDDDNEE